MTRPRRGAIDPKGGGGLVRSPPKRRRRGTSRANQNDASLLPVRARRAESISDEKTVLSALTAEIGFPLLQLIHDTRTLPHVNIFRNRCGN